MTRIIALLLLCSGGVELSKEREFCLSLQLEIVVVSRVNVI